MTRRHGTAIHVQRYMRYVLGRYEWGCMAAVRPSGPAAWVMTGPVQGCCFVSIDEGWLLGCRNFIAVCCLHGAAQTQEEPELDLPGIPEDPDHAAL